MKGGKESWTSFWTSWWLWGKKRHLGWVRTAPGSLGASTSRRVFVNSRFQIRAGCYQTFKAESNRLLLQQGRRDSVIKISRLSSFLLKVSSVSTDVNWSHKHPPSLREGEVSSPLLKLSVALCVPLVVLHLQTKLVVPFKYCEILQRDWKVCHNSILREYTCASHRNQCRAKKARSVWVTEHFMMIFH